MVLMMSSMASIASLNPRGILEDSVNLVLLLT